jgi:hypothetical protein
MFLRTASYSVLLAGTDHSEQFTRSPRRTLQKEGPIALCGHVQKRGIILSVCLEEEPRPLVLEEPADMSLSFFADLVQVKVRYGFDRVSTAP